ncbi:MAG: DUF2309 domain-containing protein, partial [Gammaproteobacteria bacterium]|nr:DUF2309 domain-containing protein [Gammaproteobacteria bacterium]
MSDSKATSTIQSSLQSRHIKTGDLDAMREDILHLLKHLEHVLPAQASIKDFVHHNTLHGYQHLSFPEALAHSREITGAKGYLGEERFREIYTQGRINLNDLESVLSEQNDLELDKVIYTNASQTEGATISHKDVILTTLLYSLKPVTNCQLTWQVEEMNALESCQNDLPSEQRQALLKSTSKTNEKEIITSLWQAVLKTLELEHLLLHPEDMLDMSPDHAKEMLSQQVKESSTKEASHSHIHKEVQKESRKLLGKLLDSIGHKITLSGFIKAVTGIEIMDDIQPVLLRHLAAYLDQGMAAWHHTEREKGFYAFWKQSSHEDINWIFEDLDDWADNLDALPDDPMDTIIQELQRQGISQDRWIAYLERIALELPGWSGMFLWRHTKPGYDGQTSPVNMLDYLAVRLVLERIFAQKVCSEYWRTEASLETLRYYFRHRSDDFLVRYTLYNERLPEYLTTLCEHQIERAKTDFSNENNWLKLANMIWTWQQSPVGTNALGYRITKHAWPLFRLFQYLGLNAQDISSLEEAQVNKIFDLIEQMDEETSGYIWLQAYELHYHEIYFNTLVDNEGRGRWKERVERPDAQLVFCMDDREEGIRRHLEELNPNIETLGAAAHFGLHINWLGLDDDEVTPLCPVVAVPAYEFQEVAHSGQDDIQKTHQKKRHLRLQAKALINQETRRNLLSTAVLIALSAPAALLTLIGKVFVPRQTGELAESIRDKFDLPISTSVSINCQHPKEEPKPGDEQVGFTDLEQADKIEGLLRNIGLAHGFAPIVVIVGHGSISQNNPHMAAYDCGACSGRHSGPNAR